MASITPIDKLPSIHEFQNVILQRDTHCDRANKFETANAFLVKEYARGLEELKAAHNQALKNAIKSTRAEQSATVVDLRKQVADLDDTLKEQAKFHDERLAQTKSFYDDFINDLHRQIDALGGTDLGQKMLKEKERRNLQDKHAKMVQEAGAIAKQIDALGE